MAGTNNRFEHEKVLGTSLICRLTLLVLLLALQAGPLWANDISDIKSMQSFRGNGDKDGKPGWYERFKPYKMNYAIWQYTKSDDNAAEVQYSLKYDIIDLQRQQDMHNFYLSYTGKFDFYMGTRDSGPVINRTSNPAAHYRYGAHVGDNSTLWLDIGIEHRSNGQVTDANAKDESPTSPTNGQYLAQIEYGKGNHEYFDGISRGSNYVSITPGWRYRDRDKSGVEYDREKLEIEGKIYFSNDSNITWGPFAGSSRRFIDYDLARILYSHTQTFGFVHFKDATIGFEYVIGTNGFATDSVDVYLIVPWYSRTSEWKIPFIVKSHFGPMDRLSNYTHSLQSVGLGLALAY